MFVPHVFEPTTSICKLTGEQEIVLTAPVRMRLRTSATVASNVVPSCVYYNENAGSWDTAGLATDSIAISMDEGDDDGSCRVNVNVSCLAFHSSDYTISSDEFDAAFRPVMLARMQPLEKLPNSPNVQYGVRGSLPCSSKPEAGSNHSLSVPAHSERTVAPRTSWRQATCFPRGDSAIEA